MEKKRCEYHVNSKKKSSIAKSISEDQNPTIAWKPKGQLVAHLHEHQVYSQMTSDICSSSSTFIKYISASPTIWFSNCQFQGGITRLLRVPESSHFLSGATDGCVMVCTSYTFYKNIISGSLHRTEKNALLILQFF